MTNFCTLFDSNYLTRGLALNESLSRVCPAYHLYVITFDDISYDYLTKAALPGLTPIALKDFEDERLLAIKPTRSAGEYCWTCTPSVILYCIRKFQLPSCTYVDADMLFYHDPQVLFDEMGDRSILITDHRFSPEYEKAGKVNGTYCVQFMYFKNNSEGLTALEWWRDRCIEWCYARLEDGKFGDQLYLEDWPTRFKGVHVLKHPGGGVAPWNLQQYRFAEENGALFITDHDDNRYPLVFFHFHSLKFYTDGMVSCSGTMYEIGEEAKRLVYLPYARKIMQFSAALRNEDARIVKNGARGPAPGKWQVFREFAKELAVMVITGKFSPFRLKNYNFSRHYHFFHPDQN
jgi:hypothetical protein